MKDEILIVGAGIGGLTAALSLHEVGFRVRVFESVSELKMLGVGINLLPHAVREMQELGLRSALESAAAQCLELAYFTKRGQRIWGEPRGLAAGYAWPQFSLHRGVLHRVLLDAARERLGTDRIHLGHHFRRFEMRSGDVAAFFGDREKGAEFPAVTGRALIAADGIHSAARRNFYPNEGPPRWNGALMWRGIAEATPVLDGRTMVMAGHTRQKFVCYPIGEPSNDSGHQSINFVAELRFDTTDLLEREDWTRPAKLSDVLPAFESWRFEWLDVPSILRAASQIWVYPMIDRDPLPRWSHGPVTLLGDAAHPMYPIGSNGASQAILDARVLAGCLRHYVTDLPRGLQRYEDLRRPATAAIVLANREQGPEIAMQLVEDRAPDGFARLDDVVNAEELRAIADKYKKLAGFAVAELNCRPSLIQPTA